MVEIFSGYFPEKFPGIGYEKFLGMGFMKHTRMGYKKFLGMGYKKFLGMGYEKFLRIGSDMFPGNNQNKISSSGKTPATVLCSYQEFLNGDSFSRNSKVNLQIQRIPRKTF